MITEPERALLRQSRVLCWKARDSFFECLDTNDNLEKKCRKLRKEFEKTCPPSWVRLLASVRQRERETNLFRQEQAVYTCQPSSKNDTAALHR